jgi:hypothetical protein
VYRVAKNSIYRCEDGNSIYASRRFE